MSSVTKELPLWKVVCLSLAMCGVQFQWSAAFATVTPFFKTKGLSDNQSNQVWVFGPLVGIIFGPLIGTMSDNCHSKMGRRRPFIVGGAIALIIALIVFGFSDDLGKAFGDKGTDNSRCIAIGYLAFAILNISINVLQGPVRVVVADLLPESQQHLGQSSCTLMQGFGAVLGNLVTYLLGVTQVHLIMSVGAAILLVTVAVTFVVAVEIPKEREEGKEVGIVQTVKNIGIGIKTMPKFLVRVCVLEFFAWFAWFTVLPTATTWMGSVVFHGDASAPLGSVQNNDYVDGTKYACLGVMFQAVAQTLTSGICPSLANKFGIRPVFFGSYVIFVGALLGMGFTRATSEKVLGNFFIALLGVPFATTNIFPYSIISTFIEDPSQQGLYIGALNIFISLPQVIDTQITGIIAEHFATSTTGGEWVVMLMGAAAAALAAFSVFTLILHKEKDVKAINNGSLKQPLMESAA